MHPRMRPHEQGVAGGKVQNRWEVRQVAGPVSPSRHESGKIPKSAFAPDIQTAFIGIARGKFND